MKDQCAIYYGVILMTDKDGEYPKEELDSLLVRIFQNNSITITNLK